MSIPFTTVKDGDSLTLDAALTASEFIRGLLRTDPSIHRRSHAGLLRGRTAGEWLAPWPVLEVHAFGDAAGSYTAAGSIVRTPDYDGSGPGQLLRADLTAGWGDELQLLATIAWTGRNVWTWNVRQAAVDLTGAPLTRLAPGSVLRWPLAGARGYVLAFEAPVATVALVSGSDAAPGGPVHLWKPPATLKFLTRTVGHRIQALEAQVGQVPVDSEMPVLTRSLTRQLAFMRVHDSMLFGGNTEAEPAATHAPQQPSGGTPQDLSQLTNRVSHLETTVAGIRQVPTGGTQNQALAKAADNSGFAWRTVSSLLASASITVSKLSAQLQARLWPTGLSQGQSAREGSDGNLEAYTPFEIDDAGLTPQEGDLVSWGGNPLRWIRARFATLHAALGKVYVKAHGPGGKGVGSVRILAVGFGPAGRGHHIPVGFMDHRHEHGRGADRSRQPGRGRCGVGGRDHRVRTTAQQPRSRLRGFGLEHPVRPGPERRGLSQRHGQAHQPVGALRTRTTT